MNNEFGTVYNSFGVRVEEAPTTLNGGLSTLPNLINESVNPGAVGSGSFNAQISYVSGFLQSSNFLTGSTGWQIKYDGSVEFNNGVFRGALSASTIDIPNTTTANSFHTDSQGNSWWGATTLGASKVKITKDGQLTFSDVNGDVVGIGTVAGRGISMSLTTLTNIGIVISSAVAGSGFNYSNSTNVAARGLNITLSNTGGNNNLPAIEVTYAGIGNAQLITTSNTANSLSISNSGTGVPILINDTSTTGSTGAIIVQNYNRNGNIIDLTSNSTGGNPTGIKFNMAGTTNPYAFGFNGSEFVSSAVGGTQNRKIRVLVNGSVYFIPCYDA